MVAVFFCNGIDHLNERRDVKIHLCLIQKGISCRKSALRNGIKDSDYLLVADQIESRRPDTDRLQGGFHDIGPDIDRKGFDAGFCLNGK